MEKFVGLLQRRNAELIRTPVGNVMLSFDTLNFNGKILSYREAIQYQLVASNGITWHIFYISPESYNIKPYRSSFCNYLPCIPFIYSILR